MNFDIEKAKIIPFSVNKELVKKSFLNWTYDKHETPLDIIQKSQLIEIKKSIYL